MNYLTKPNQLNIFQQINHKEILRKLNAKPVIKDEPYRNAKGELLPWEEPEYIETAKKLF